MTKKIPGGRIVGYIPEIKKEKVKPTSEDSSEESNKSNRGRKPKQ